MLMIIPVLSSSISAKHKTALWLIYNNAHPQLTNIVGLNGYYVHDKNRRSIVYMDVNANGRRLVEVGLRRWQREDRRRWVRAWKVNTLDPHLIHLHLVCYADIQEAEWWLVWQEEVK